MSLAPFRKRAALATIVFCAAGAAGTLASPAPPAAVPATPAAVPPTPAAVPATPTPAAVPSPGASAEPLVPPVTPSPVVTVPPSPAPPSASPTLPYHSVFVFPTAAPAEPPGPQIAEIDLSDQTIVPPTVIRVAVHTSADVVAVVATAFGQRIDVPQQGPGLFGIAQQLGDVPDVVRGHTIRVRFTARSADGRTSGETIPVAIR